MNNVETVLYLREKIKEILAPEIDKKCILIDVPYYNNIGDVLIWEGEKDFLKDIKVELICTASYWTFNYPILSKDVTVLFNGGGNIGDLYPEHIKFLLEVSKHYPENKIVVLPQTVYYKDKSLMRADLIQLNKHKNLLFCARDNEVANEVSKYITNVVSVPDMAFYNCIDKLNKYAKQITKEKLIIKRDDAETGKSNTSIDGVIADWPTLTTKFRYTTFICKILYKFAIHGLIFKRIWNWYCQSIHTSLMIKEGVEFISPFKKVETTRLHGCILSILLDKEITLVDNSYGKNKGFYSSWLSNDKNVKLKE